MNPKKPSKRFQWSQAVGFGFIISPLPLRAPLTGAGEWPESEKAGEGAADDRVKSLTLISGDLNGRDDWVKGSCNDGVWREEIRSFSQVGNKSWGQE